MMEPKDLIKSEHRDTWTEVQPIRLKLGPLEFYAPRWHSPTYLVMASYDAALDKPARVSVSRRDAASLTNEDINLARLMLSDALAWETVDRPVSAEGQALGIKPNPKIEFFGVPLCTCTTINSSFEGNPEGHDVLCPRWGTKLPNTSLSTIG